MENKFELRKIKGTDLGKVCKIVSKIGINKIADEFGKDKIKDIMANFSAEESNNDIAAAVGIDVALNCANIILANIENVIDDVLDYLSDLSGLDKDVINDDPAMMMDMIFEFVKKDEFNDFYQVVLKFIN